MNEHAQDGRRFIGYEYKSVTVERDMANLYIDCFPYFGWTFEEKQPTVNWAASVTLKFKRERKMINKMELTRLQRKFECRKALSTQNFMMQALNLDIKNPKSEVERVLKLVSMAGAANRKLKQCSLGMKQRLGVAQSLLGRPRLLVLDV